MNALFLFDLAQPALRHHTAYGRHLLPGLAYIDFLYQFFRARGHDAAELALRDLTIYRPLIVEQGRPRRCEVEARPTGDGRWHVGVRERPDASAAAAAGVGADAGADYASAEMMRIARPVFTSTLSPDVRRRHAQAAMPMDAIYERCRRYEVMQTGFMKAEGTVSYSDSELIADLHVGDDAAPTAGRLLFHPALMDAAAVCAASALARFLPTTETGLALPIYYETFRASGPIQRRCLVRVRAAAMARKGVARYMTLELFDESGRQIAELVNLAATVVRDPALIGGAGAQPAITSRNSPRRADATDASAVSPARRPREAAAEHEHLLRTLIAERLRCPVAAIDAAAGYYELGLDSVALLELARDVGRALCVAVPPTLFFEYTTIAALAAHLAANHDAPVARVAATASAPAERPAATPRSEPLLAPREPRGRIGQRATDGDTAAIRARDIAVIGMAGRFPGASDLDTFWRNLQAGRDAITGIPADRWDHARYFSAEPAAGKTRSRWGGFIDDVEAFDPLFFGIAPRAAQLIDPQVRLFLETVWHLFEGAGCTRERLRRHYASEVGVYVGTMYQQYGWFEAGLDREAITAMSSPAAIANRVSYWFGLNGPSLALDSLCSSSLAAVHLACKDLMLGECRLAVVGGINLSIHPKKYVGLSQLQLLAAAADRRSFADGDGLIPAEAVAAVLLKPLGRAIEDGDDVLAVIRGTAANHGGRSSGFTAPSVDAQARVIADCLEAAGASPDSIGYVEAAATGAALSDAIEIAALQKVFGPADAGRGVRAIGSVKSNIGHAEAASGLTQLIKVILQLRHAQLVPSIGASPPNPHASLDAAALRLQRELAPWPRATVERDGAGIEQPRRALINSFGAGGSNTSAVVEEFIPPLRPADDESRETARQESQDSAGPHVMVFSARTDERLRVVAGRMLTHLRDREDVPLADLAWTLQCGREAMASRLAIVVRDRQQLLCALQMFLDEPDGASSRGRCVPFHTGLASDDRADDVRDLAAGGTGEAMVRLCLDSSDLDKLALLWAHGADVPWHELSGGRVGRIVPLPSYPFERIRCWLPDARVDATVSRDIGPSERPRIELEQDIASIWEQVLGISGIGIHDSFLELGGSSFTAVQVCARLREQFAVEVPVRVLIGPRATIESLAVEVVCGLARQRGVAIDAHLDAVM